MTDEQLLRYSRHILLDEIGVDGQERLLSARAVVIGAGGLGSPVALYLASAGVGHITVIDHDTVDVTNLQRQIAHNLARVGWPKANSAQAAMQAINPEVRIEPIVERADDALLDAVLPGADVVLDCTDNFRTRHLINRACLRHGVVLVSGAAIRFDGQLSVYDPGNPHSPCYACVFPETQAFEETRCATMGVFAPLVGIIGTMQAAEALKWMVGLGSRLVGRLLMLDGRAMALTEVQLSRQPQCPVCSAHRHTHQAPPSAHLP